MHVCLSVLFVKNIIGHIPKQKRIVIDVFSQDVFHVTIPVVDLSDPKRKKQTLMRLPMVLPHELLNWLHVSWSTK